MIFRAGRRKRGQDYSSVTLLYKCVRFDGLRSIKLIKVTKQDKRRISFIDLSQYVLREINLFNLRHMGKI